MRSTSCSKGMPAASAAWGRRLVSAFSYDDRVLMERFVEGRELAVSVLGGEALPVVEAIPAEGDRYDFEARYAIGRTRFVCPAELSEYEQRAVTEAALATYRALGCTGFARVDLILDSEGPWILEANAIPGLTDTSLLPQAAEAAGMPFEQLVERILDLALHPAAA
jgi:D-alanine-D-alanine ligase